VVVIDEPRGKHYYGGDVAAPVFREVMQDLRRMPNGPFSWSPSMVAVKPPAPAPVVVPDLRLLPQTAAERRLASLGLRGRAAGAGPRVVAQTPAAGEASERGGLVTLWLSAPDDSSAHAMPDLVGLSTREALRRLSPCQVRARIEGAGRVVRQLPAPGTPLGRRAECRLWCEPQPVADAGRVNAVVARASGP
jgi:stage V sporulation protein D (sporulation-specific penicillin-binding protein)